MTDTVNETRIFGQILDSSDNLYRLKNIGKTHNFKNDSSEQLLFVYLNSR